MVYDKLYLLTYVQDFLLLKIVLEMTCNKLLKALSFVGTEAEAGYLCERATAS